MSTADAAKAKQIQDAATEINAAKAEAERLREQLAQKENTLRDLQSANASLATSLAEKDEELKAEEIALVSMWQELERHIYEDTIVDGDILRKFRIPETVKRRKLSLLVFLTIPFVISQQRQASRLQRAARVHAAFASRKPPTLSGISSRRAAKFLSG